MRTLESAVVTASLFDKYGLVIFITNKEVVVVKNGYTMIVVIILVLYS